MVLANIFHALIDTFGPVLVFLHSIIGSAAILATASKFLGIPPSGSWR
jgi:hypothetical protein